MIRLAPGEDGEVFVDDAKPATKRTIAIYADHLLWAETALHERLQKLIQGTEKGGGLHYALLRLMVESNDRSKTLRIAIKELKGYGGRDLG